jgi:TRAP-type mannitol/chloroaromatic compound transport system substrate-binding protein
VHRRAFLRAGAAAAAVAAPAVAAPAVAQSAPEVRWRMTSSFTKLHDTLFGAGQMLCRYVAEATDNKFQIQAYSAGELATSGQALDVVASGAVECAHTPLGLHTGKDMTLGFGSGVPFGLNARHQQSWWMFGGGARIVNAVLQRLNTFAVPAGAIGAQMGGWFKREINSIEDLKSLRFRINGMGSPIFARLGAAVFDTMSHADVIGALERNTIDGAEFLCPHDDDKLGLARVARYNYWPCWWESAGMVHLVVNLAKWNALPNHYRAVVLRACDSAHVHLLAKYDSVNPPALKRLIAAGAVIRPFPQPVMEAFHRATNEHFAEVAAKDPQFKKANESVNAFRREHLQWLQISEHALDGFLINAGRA